MRAHTVLALLLLAAPSAWAEEAPSAAEAPGIEAYLDTVLRVASTPSGAAVTVDGHECGVTPLVIAATPGAHTVAGALGPLWLSVEVTAEAGTLTEVHLALERSDGPPRDGSAEDVDDLWSQEGAAPEPRRSRSRRRARRRSAPVAEPWRHRVPVWPWVDLWATLGASMRSLAVPINPDIDAASRSEARFDTGAFLTGSVGARVTPFARARSPYLRGLGFEGRYRGTLLLHVYNRRMNQEVDADFYEADVAAVYALPLTRAEHPITLSVVFGWHRTSFFLGDVSNDIVPPFVYDTLRIGVGASLPVWSRHFSIEVAGAYLPVLGVGQDAEVAYGGSGFLPTSHAGELHIAAMGHVGGLDIGFGWTGRWMTSAFEGIGRGFGVEPTTVIGLGGDGIETTGDVSDAVHSFDLTVGYRF